MDDDPEQCDNCIFSTPATPLVTGRWRKKRSVARVHCRRYPRPSGGEYPIQFADDWCGEWDDGESSDDNEREDLPLRLVQNG